MCKRCILIVILIILPSPILAKVTFLNFANDKGKLWISGEVVTRYENWNWFEPVSEGNDNNDYDYFFTRSRLGLGYESKWVEVFLQAQDVHIWDLPEDAIAPTPAGPLGVGAIYYAHRRNRNYHSTFIKQGYVRLRNILNSGISLKGGRFEYLDGLEVTYNNPKVMWLKKIRIAERLVGPVEWSAFTRSFDGGELSLDKALFNFTTTISHPTEGVCENDGNHHLDDVTLVTAALTLKYDQIIPHTENRLFYIFYNDDRKASKVDNTPIESGINQGNIEIHTLGFHLLNTLELGPGVTDILFWGTGQWGDWGELSHRAWAWAAEVGYQLIDLPTKPWLRIGYSMASGDSNPIDSTHETFFQILPSVRRYALFCFYNQMNNEDFFIQLIMRPLERMLIRADVHFLHLNEREDKWYMGTGATKDRGNIFGYIGRPSFGESELAKVLDFMIIYNINQHIYLNAYYGRAWGDDVIENIYWRDYNADFFSFEFGLKF